MNENQKFEQIWGFRRNIDSSSDDSKSNSDVGNGQEKLGLDPSLVSPENDRVSETDDHKHVQVVKKAKRVRNGPKKETIKKKREVKSKPKKDSCASSNIKKGGNSSRKKKSKLTTVSDDLRIFMESILDDLRVARETMFAKMRREMDRLVKSKPSSRSTKKKGSVSNHAKNPNQKPRARKTKTTRAKPKQNNELATSKGLDHPQEQAKPKQNNELATSKGLDRPQEQAKTEKANEPSSKKPILIDSSAKKPIFTNTQDQIVTSSSYLTLPLVLANSRSNDTSLKLESGNYSGGFQGEERYRSFVHNSTESSCVGNGYPFGLNHHQRLDNSNVFGIPNRIVQGFSHDGNLLGTRIMNGGGIRYSAGLTGHTLPNHLASNGFRGIYPN